MDLGELPPIMWVVAFQIGLHCMAWLLAAVLLHEEREVLLHWAGFNALLGLGLLLAGARTEDRLWITYNGANVLTLLGFALMRRGSEKFLNTGCSDGTQALWTGPSLLGLLLLPPTVEWASARAFSAFAGQGLVLLAMTVSIGPPLEREFGARTRWALALPCALFGLLNLALALRQALLWPQAQELQISNTHNLGLMYAYLLGSAVFACGFLVVVVLRLTRKLRNASRTDELTGLLNRRAMNEFLEGQWHRHLRRRYPLALVMVDLDHFKRVNDTLGHAAGDAVLRRTADLLRRHLRREDMISRMGGEEFLLVLPDTEQDAALALSERLRHMAHEEGLGVTMSLGLTMASNADADAEVAVQRADAALYRAKAEGRDRVAVTPAPATTPGTALP